MFSILSLRTTNNVVRSSSSIDSRKFRSLSVCSSFSSFPRISVFVKSLMLFHQIDLPKASSIAYQRPPGLSLFRITDKSWFHFLQNRGEVVWRPGAGNLKSETLDLMALIPFIDPAFHSLNRRVGNEQGTVEKHLLVPSCDVPRLETTFTETHGRFFRDV